MTKKFSYQNYMHLLFFPILGCWATPYQCNYYDKNYCKSGVCESKIISCKKEVTQCYSLWYNKTGTVQLVQQGCLLNGDTCSEGPECIGRPHFRGVLFCCCRGNFCNENFTSVEITPVSTYTTKPPVTTGKLGQNVSTTTTCNNFISIIFFCTCIIIYIIANNTFTILVTPRGRGGTPIYWLYGYVPLERVWFSSHLVW